MPKKVWNIEKIYESFLTSTFVLRTHFHYVSSMASMTTWYLTRQVSRWNFVWLLIFLDSSPSPSQWLGCFRSIYNSVGFCTVAESRSPEWKPIHFEPDLSIIWLVLKDRSSSVFLDIWSLRLRKLNLYSFAFAFQLYVTILNSVGG